MSDFPILLTFLIGSASGGFVGWELYSPYEGRLDRIAWCMFFVGFLCIFAGLAFPDLFILLALGFLARKFISRKPIHPAETQSKDTPAEAVFVQRRSNTK